MTGKWKKNPDKEMHEAYKRIAVWRKKRCNCAQGNACVGTVFS